VLQLRNTQALDWFPIKTNAFSYRGRPARPVAPPSRFPAGRFRLAFHGGARLICPTIGWDTNRPRRAIELAKREKFNVRQLAQRLGEYSSPAFVGTASAIADQMEKWLVSDV
jgi:hypothetical protein